MAHLKECLWRWPGSHWEPGACGLLPQAKICSLLQLLLIRADFNISHLTSRPALITLAKTKAIWEVSWQRRKTLAKPGRTIRYALYMHLLKKDSYSVHTCPRPWNDWKFVNWNGDENPPGNCCTCWTGRLKLKNDEDWPPDPSLPWITTLFTMPEVMKKCRENLYKYLSYRNMIARLRDMF